MTDWNDKDRYPFLATLEQNAAIFLAEALAIPDSLFVPMPDEDNYTPGAWLACPMVLEQWAQDALHHLLVPVRE